MKLQIAVITILLFMATSTAAFAGRYSHHGYGGHYGGSRYYDYHRGGGHHDNDLGIALGIIGGVVLLSALVNAYEPRPKRVIYGSDYSEYRHYQPEVVVQQPRCMEHRRVSGEWQLDSTSGRRVWVSFAYPIYRSFRVACY